MIQILMRKNVALKKIPKSISFTCISGLALHFWQRLCPSRHCQISPGGAMSSYNGWWFSTITNKKRFAQRFLQSESCQPGRMVIFNHGQQETEIPTEIRILPTWPCPHWKNDFQPWPTRDRNYHKPGSMGRWVLWGEDWTEVELGQRRFLCQPKEIAIDSLENVLGPTDWDNVLTIDLRVWSAPPLPPFFVLSLSLLLLVLIVSTIITIVAIPILLPSFLSISASSPSSVSLRPVLLNIYAIVMKQPRKQETIFFSSNLAKTAFSRSSSFSAFSKT